MGVKFIKTKSSMDIVSVLQVEKSSGDWLHVVKTIELYA